jgi:hypothetical protein
MENSITKRGRKGKRMQNEEFRIQEAGARSFFS